MEYTRHTACLFRANGSEKMKRLYTKLTGETFESSESNPSLTGLLAAFLCGVLCCMLLHWLLF
jgi:hypothetical protein